MYQEQHSSSRLLVGVLFVVALHVAVVVALKNGLVRDLAPMLPRNLEAYFIQDVQPKEPPPMEEMKIEQPVIEPIITEPVIDIPPIETPMETVVQADTGTTQPSDTAGTGDGPAITEFKVDSRFPLSKPDYPAQSVRLQEEGSVTLMIYVLPNGRVGQAKVSRSSGYPRLDQSAVREALRSWRFLPQKVGSQAVASWGTFKVRFKLDQA